MGQIFYPYQKKIRFLSIIFLIMLISSCTLPPTNINNACSMLKEKRSFFSSWGSALAAAERRYHIPAHVILATIHVESSFKAYAKPRRRKLLGFIPWKRLSSAYGYAQALDGTWEYYQKMTHNPNASRTNFADSVDFIAWFHDRSVRYNHIHPEDTYNLYLNYYLGHKGYATKRYKISPAIRGAAQRAASIANAYKQQLRYCFFR